MKKEIQSFSKTEIRERLTGIRKIVPVQRRLVASSRLLEQLVPLLENYNFILSFASFRDEIDLWPLNQLLISQRKLLLPKVVNNKLYIYQVEDLSHLTHSSWNILEPSPKCRPIDYKEISCVLVPGLGFDRENNRIGYGKGHYDQLLSALPHSYKIGVGFKEQLIEDLPTEDHDQKCDQIFLF